MSDSLLQKAIDFFTSRGWSQNQAAGIAGNLFGESQLDIRAVGDGGKAFGIAQWHPDRQANFARVFGKSIRNSTFEEQLAFVDWELRNTEKSAGQALLGTGTIAEAVRTFMQKYERPANMSSLGARTSAANRAYGLATGTMPDQSWGEWWNDPNSSWSDLDPTGISGTASSVSEFLSYVFTKEFAARFGAVFIGIIFIGLAIAAFVLLGDTKKELISTVAKAAS